MDDQSREIDKLWLDNPNHSRFHDNTLDQKEGSDSEEELMVPFPVVSPSVTDDPESELEDSSCEISDDDDDGKNRAPKTGRGSGTYYSGDNTKQIRIGNMSYETALCWYKVTNPHARGPRVPDVHYGRDEAIRAPWICRFCHDDEKDPKFVINNSWKPDNLEDEVESPEFSRQPQPSTTKYLPWSQCKTCKAPIYSQSQRFVRSVQAQGFTKNPRAPSNKWSFLLAKEKGYTMAWLCACSIHSSNKRAAFNFPEAEECYMSGCSRKREEEGNYAILAPSEGPSAVRLKKKKVKSVTES